LELNPFHGENWVGIYVTGYCIPYTSLLFVSLIIIVIKVKLTIKFTLEQVMKAQRGSRDIALHFL